MMDTGASLKIKESKAEKEGEKLGGQSKNEGQADQLSRVV